MLVPSGKAIGIEKLAINFEFLKQNIPTSGGFRPTYWGPTTTEC